MRKLSSLASLLIGAVLVVPYGAGAASSDDLATRRLIDQAMHWQKKGRDDLAIGIWQKLLKADPTNPDALVELGNIEVRAGRMQEARTYLDRAKALPTPPQRLGELEMALVGGTKPIELAAARKEAVAGNTEQAVNRYQAVLGSNAKPEGQLGLEYYQTLGGTKGGWSEARRGLEGLAQKNPGDERYLLALARHLTYREGTRREGIRQLSALSNRSTNGDEAQKAWRQALVWLGNSPADIPLYSAYLRRYPSDATVKERLNQIERTKIVRPAYRPDAQQIARQTGFRLLNAGDVAQAENKFISLLKKNPRDADALAGLGIVRLRQEQFSESVQLLDQAIKHGSNSSRWANARRSAMYWRDLQPILAAQAEGSLEGQERAIKQVIRLDPSEPVAQLLLADLAAERKDFRQAEAVYRKVLKKTPNHPQALRGLVSVLTETGRSQEVMELLARVDNGNGEQTGGMQQAKAVMLVSVAEADERAGRLENALASLEDALLLDPASAKVRFALAKLYQRLGDSGAATALMDDLEATNLDQVGTHEMRANLLAEQKRWWEALQELEKLPASRRTQSIAREQKRYWVNVQVERARQFFSKGAQREAQSVLSHVEQAAGSDTGLQALVASAWSEIGQTNRALRISRQVASRGMVSVSAKLQYAGILLGARQDVELLVVLRELSNNPNLSAQEQTELNNLITAYTLRRADSLRESGRIAEAYDILQPVLQQSADPRLLMALARVYESGKEPENALRIAEDVIAQEPNVLEHRLFAASVASNARSYDRAGEHVDAALAIAPDHPRVLATAGRVEKARGNLSRAMEYFQYAQALEKDTRAFAGVPGNLALRLVDQQVVQDRQAPLNARINSNILPLPKSAGHNNLNQSSQLYPIPQNMYAAPLPASRSVKPSANVLSLPRSVEPVTNYPEPSVQPRRFEKNSNRLLPLSRNTVESDAGYFLQPARQEIAPTVLPVVGNQFVAQNDRAEKLPPLPSLRASRSQERTVEDEIRDISLRSSTTLSAGGGFRSRSGETGMSQMTSFESALEARLPLDFDAAVVLRITPVLLDAGKVELAQTNIAPRFGSAGLGAFIATPYAARSQEDSGVALSLTVQTNDLSADIGTTPLGFAIQNMVGGISLTNDFDGVTLKGSLSRRPVIDSVLSYAGTVDPRTGNMWGGVLKTGGKLDLTIGDDAGGVYAGLGAYSLSGTKVKANRLLDLGIGAYWRAYQTIDTKVTLGLNLTSLSYQYNLGQFTLGHGGYFSPQRYVALGLPFDVAGRRGRVSFEVGGDFGIRSIKQDDTPYYPDDSALQSTWEATAATLGGAYQTRYAATSSSGFGYKLFAKLEYNINNKLVVGGRISSDNSSNYNQQQGLIYIRHAFEGVSQPIAYPPKPLRLFSEGEAL